MSIIKKRIANKISTDVFHLFIYWSIDSLPTWSSYFSGKLSQRRDPEPWVFVAMFTTQPSTSEDSAMRGSSQRRQENSAITRFTDDAEVYRRDELRTTGSGQRILTLNMEELLLISLLQRHMFVSCLVFFYKFICQLFMIRPRQHSLQYELCNIACMSYKFSAKTLRLYSS